MIEKVRPFVYLVVIGMAFTLREPWLIVIQAAVGGFALGAWVERKLRRSWISVSSQAMNGDQQWAASSLARRGPEMMPGGWIGVVGCLIMFAGFVPLFRVAFDVAIDPINHDFTWGLPQMHLFSWLEGIGILVLLFGFIIEIKT